MDAEQVAPSYVTLRVGEDALEYRELAAYDATGRELPSSMTLADNTIGIDVDDRDAVYPVTIDPLTVTTNYFLQPAVGLRNALYATTAAVYGNVAVVGEPDDPSATGIATGAVHVFRRGTNNAWTAERTIRMGVPPAESTSASFGRSVDVWGNYLIAGAPGEGSSRGAAYIIDLNGSFDSQGRPASPVRLVAPSRVAGQQFGYVVAISSNGTSSRVVIGTAGVTTPRAFTFANGGSGWYHESTLPTSGTPTGLFGSVVDIDPTNMNLAVIGAPSTSSGAGAVHIYHRAVCCWPPTPAVLNAPSGRTRFGSSLSASDSRIGIGGATSSSTKAELRVATGSGTSWSTSSVIISGALLSTDSAYAFTYGSAHRTPQVAISGAEEMLGFPNAAPIGAPATSAEGTVDAPEITGLSQTNYTPSATHRSRGQALAMDGSTALIARVDSNLGTIRAYNLRLTNGSSCSDPGECASGYCVDGVCCNTSCGGGATNDCQACSTALGGTSTGTCTTLSVSYAPTVQCRASSGAPCDLADYCVAGTTTCFDTYRPSGTLCRASAGPCDVQEVCTGGSPSCPADAFVSSGTVCEAADEPCEVSATCTGSSAACPSTGAAPAGTPCGGAPSGPCDVQDQCNGSSFACPALYASPGTVCLAANGVCDADDVCTGSSTDCPASYLSAGTLCRPAAPICDVAEYCDGASADCPSDVTIPDCGPEICGSGSDEDLDGLTDCFDSADCASHPTCGTTELSCSDGIDNDADGTTDCADATECPNGTVCNGTGDQICIDAACVPRVCGDGYREPGGSWPREGCDDGNTSDGDACSSTCAPSVMAVWSYELTESSPGRRTPGIAADASGQLLFVFTRDTGSTRAVMARRFTPSGIAVDTTPITLRADVGLGWDAQPTVAGLAGGGWVVAWTDPFVDGDGAGIATLRVHADGSLGAITKVNTDARGAQREARVAALGTGWVVVWTDESGLAGPLGESVLQMRQYSSTGTPLADESRITDHGHVASSPAIAVSGARWIVAWADALSGTVGTPIVAARRFGGSGDDPTFFEASTATADGAEPAVTTLGTGDFALAWVQRTGDALGNIATRTIAASGDPLSGSPTLFSAADAQTAPAIARLSSSTGYVIAYEDGGRRRGAAFAAVGGTLASESTALASALDDGLQGDPSLLHTANGVWFAWSDARDSAPAATGSYRSFLAFLLPHD